MTAPGNPATSPGTSRATTWLACLLYPVGPAAIVLMPMIIGGLIDSYGYSEQQAGNIAAAEGMGVVVSSVVAALWIRRVSWVRALLLSFLAYVALNAVSASVADYGPLLALRFLTGFAGGNLFAVSVAALGDDAEPDRAFGLAQAVQGVLMAAAFLAAPALRAAGGVGALYYLLAGAALAGLPMLRAFPAAGRVGPVVAAREPAAQQTGLILLGLFASVLFFINVFGFWGFVERIGLNAGLSGDTVGFALAVSQVGPILGALAAAWASHRFGRYWPLLIVLAGQVWALIALRSSFDAPTFYLATNVFQALFVVGVSYQMGAVAELDVRGRFLVMMTAAQGLGSAVGPAIAGGLIRGDDYGGVVLLALATCVASSLLFILIVWRSRAPALSTGAPPPL